MKKKILIIVCSGTLNRGTEALVRGTIVLLERSFGENFEVTLASSMPEIDKEQNIPYVINNIYRISPNSNSLFSRICGKIKRILRIQDYNVKELRRAASKSDLILVVGADNYDIAYNLYPSLHYINKKLRRSCKGKLFLYDCSLNKESVTDDFFNELRLFDAVSVREIQTLDNINEVNNSKHEIAFIPDPAFVMQKDPVQLPERWIENKMIGVNLSTLIVGSSYGENLKDKVLSCYQFMIDKILEETDLSVVLIPHVMNGADLSILNEIKALYNEEDRVVLIDNENYSAPELKYIISKCRFFVGARTHATIAAYSSCVPTLVLGYSTKSIGIARDLFGTDKGYVVSVQNLTNKTTLWDNLKVIIKNENQMRSHLDNKIPQYIESSYLMSNLFTKLLSHE